MGSDELPISDIQLKFSGESGIRQKDLDHTMLSKSGDSAGCIEEIAYGTDGLSGTAEVKADNLPNIPTSLQYH
jgi:hypothetical protein